MKPLLPEQESGQAVVEFALIALVLMMLTAGVIDVGRGFYQYSAIEEAARGAARWGSVVGGTCSRPTALSNLDWCNKVQTSSANSQNFWAQSGNAPLQTGGQACPTSFDPTNGFPYYTVANFTPTSANPNPTTIVGAIAQHFDTNSSTANTTLGSPAPGFDLSQLKVCIQMHWDSTFSVYRYQAGDTVTVYVYYTFTPAGPLLGNVSLPLTAAFQEVIE